MTEREFERAKALAEIAADFVTRGYNNRVCTLVLTSAHPMMVAALIANALDQECAERFARMIGEVER